MQAPWNQRIESVLKVKVTRSCLTLRFHGLQLSRLLYPWNSPGRNTGGGCYSLLQGIFPTQGSNPSRALQADSLPSDYHHYILSTLDNTAMSVFHQRSLPSFFWFASKAAPWLWYDIRLTIIQYPVLMTITAFQIGKGVHEGCILSSCLFNLYSEYIMWNAKLD